MVMNKKVLITGGTGMIGSLILDLCLQSKEVDEVVLISRRSIGIQHHKLIECIVSDPLELSQFKTHLNDVNIVFYCLGVYTGKVPPLEFRKITVDYPLALAKILVETAPGLRFCLLSGQGADRSEKSKLMFARDKGAIENKLSALEHLSFHAFRPGYIYPVVPRKEPNLGYSFSRWLYPVIRLLGKNLSITSIQLAQVMFTVGLNGNEKEILENKDMVVIAESIMR
jgi:nucleoside-diphosphate-sugar epimerase